LRESSPKIQATGVRLACIVQARSEDLEGLCGAPEYSLGPPNWPLFECVPDPEHKTHDLVGLLRMPWWKMLAKRDLWRRQRAAAQLGFRQSWRRTLAAESDKLRNPGAALVDRNGKILWLYRGDHPADLPSTEDLLAIAGEYGVSVSS
jgi:hypothetical protein